MAAEAAEAVGAAPEIGVRVAAITADLSDIVYLEDVRNEVRDGVPSSLVGCRLVLGSGRDDVLTRNPRPTFGP